MNNKERYNSFLKNMWDHVKFYYKGIYFSLLLGFVATLIMLFMKEYTFEGLVFCASPLLCNLLRDFLEKMKATGTEMQFAKKTIVDTSFPEEIRNSEDVKFSNCSALGGECVKRKNHVGTICDNIKSGKNVVVFGESGSGKSVLILQALNELIESNSFFTERQTQDCPEIVSKYTEFHYVVLKPRTNGSEYLVIDQVDNLSIDEIKTVFAELGAGKKILCAVKSCELYKVIAAFNSLMDVKLLNLMVTKNERNLFGPKGREKSAAWSTMKWLSEQLEGGKVKLVQYQFINLIYQNNYSDIFKDLSPESADFFKICEVRLFKELLMNKDSEEYAACLGLLRLMSDNKMHSLDEAQNVVMLKDNVLLPFCEKLKDMNFLRKVTPSGYQPTHEWIGSDVFTNVSAQLLCGDTVNYIDLYNNNRDKYNAPVKKGFANLLNEEKVCDFFVIIAVLLNLVFSWLALCRNSQLDAKLYLLTLNFAIFSGLTYVCNFYKKCSSVCGRKENVVLQLLLLVFVTAPQCGLVWPSLEFLYRYGLMSFGIVNTAIGAVYLLGSKNKEESAKAWLIKKGKRFSGIGCFVVALGIFVGSFYNSNRAAAIFFIFCGIFCWLSAANYIHFQSLVWQRIMLCLDEGKIKKTAL